MNAKHLAYPTEFTVEELQKLRELTLKAVAAERSAFLHNLAVKCGGYVEGAHRALARQFRLAS